MFAEKQNRNITYLSSKNDLKLLKLISSNQAHNKHWSFWRAHFPDFSTSHCYLSLSSKLTLLYLTLAFGNSFQGPLSNLLFMWIAFNVNHCNANPLAIIWKPMALVSLEMDGDFLAFSSSKWVNIIVYILAHGGPLLVISIHWRHFLPNWTRSRNAYVICYFPEFLYSVTVNSITCYSETGKKKLSPMDSYYKS